MNRFYFLSFGLLGLAALLTQYIHFWDFVGFLSLFTIWSALLAVSVFLYIGISLQKVNKKSVYSFFGAAVCYETLTLITYWIFLRNEPVAIPWVNYTLHLVLPLSVVFGWIKYKHNNLLKYSEVLKWLVFPIIFLTYSLTRQALSTWTTYSFLNPKVAHGYQGVAINAACLLILLILLG